MKKLLLLTLTTFTSFIVTAQNTVPNGGFENWSSVLSSYPSSYVNNSNFQNYILFHAPINVTQSTDAFHGSFAALIETNTNGTDTCGGFITNSANTNGNPSTWTGGVAYNQIPDGISGYYKYNVAAGDSAIVLVVFKNAGATIGFYVYKIGGNYSTYTPFNFTFSPALASAPDSVIVAFASSDLITHSPGVIGSSLLIDSVTFTGAVTQPAQFNGDFESWQTESFDSPANWNVPFNGSYNSPRTGDAASGFFALQLQTSIGNNQSGTPRANPGFLSNGNYSQGCNCWQGGSPFSGMVDTLAFSYKYAPADPNDTATVTLFFKSAGALMGFAQHFILASPSYQTMEVPIQLFSSPDSVIIVVQSSTWNDSTVNFAGAVLKVDDFHFKSTVSVGISSLNFNSSEINVFPNPMSSFSTFEINSSVDLKNAQLKITDVLGQTISVTDVSSHKINFNRNNLAKGIYYYEFLNDNKALKTGKLIIE